MRTQDEIFSLQDAHEQRVKDLTAEMEARHSALMSVVREQWLKEKEREMAEMRAMLAGGGGGGGGAGAAVPGSGGGGFAAMETLANERRAYESRIQQIKVRPARCAIVQ